MRRKTMAHALLACSIGVQMVGQIWLVCGTKECQAIKISEVCIASMSPASDDIGDNGPRLNQGQRAVCRAMGPFG
jgi:hypothetical protein